MSDEPKPKNWVTPQLKAAGLSHFFPGIGQFYNQEYVKGGAFLGVTVATLILMVVFVARGFRDLYGSFVGLADPTYNETVNPIAALGPGLLLMGAVILLFLWSILDAWKVAKRKGNQAPAQTAVEPGGTRAPVLPPPLSAPGGDQEV